MKEIKEFNSENLQRLKRWIADAALQGHSKYFEILVDGIRVIHKTSKLEEFDMHIKWIDDSTQTMDSRNQKAALDETIELIGRLLPEPMTKTSLIEQLCFEMDCKERTVEARLKSILTLKLAVPDQNGLAKLLCKRQENREIVYYLSD